MVSEKMIFEGSLAHYKALYKHMTPLGVDNLDPRGLIGRIYVGDHKTVLHTKYIRCAPHGFRKEDCFPIIFLWELMTPEAWPVWAPRA